jgi:hypothetical protein
MYVYRCTPAGVHVMEWCAGCAGVRHPLGLASSWWRCIMSLPLLWATLMALAACPLQVRSFENKLSEAQQQLTDVLRSSTHRTDAHKAEVSAAVPGCCRGRVCHAHAPYVSTVQTCLYAKNAACCH